MEMNFCRRCGTPVTHIENDTVYRCENEHTLFASPSPTVGIFFIDADLSTVFAVRGRDPGKGLLDTPGGFIDPRESVEAALSRELEEELGLQYGDYEPPVYFASAPGTYRYQAEDRSVITLAYVSRLKPGVTLVPQDDVADVKIIPLGNINIDELANSDIKQLAHMLQQKML